MKKRLKSKLFNFSRCVYYYIAFTELLKENFENITAVDASKYMEITSPPMFSKDLRDLIPNAGIKKYGYNVPSVQQSLKDKLELTVKPLRVGIIGTNLLQKELLENDLNVKYSFINYNTQRDLVGYDILIITTPINFEIPDFILGVVDLGNNEFNNYEGVVEHINISEMSLLLWEIILQKQ